ncbi:MAG: esterase/lipase family protein [Rhodospirillales bacterium]
MSVVPRRGVALSLRGAAQVTVLAALLVAQGRAAEPVLPELTHAEPGPQSDVEQTCAGNPAPFASCRTAERNFESVLLAVHGWNGACASTFGDGRDTLFAVLAKRFYDLDCFAYDGRHTPIDKNAAHLRNRLLDLKTAGYKEIFLVTHSTGGILALHLLADVFLNQAGSLADYRPWWSGPGLTIVGIHAWATPINGLKSGASVAAFLAALTSYSPETTRDLASNSQYLKTLKGRLQNLESAHGSATGPWPARLEIPVVFYQGQGNDWVVTEIDPHKASTKEWFGSKLPRKVVATNIGHSNNIGNPGQIGLATWPSELMDRNTLLNMTLLPRYQDVFAEQPVLTKAVVDRQRRVVEGIGYYAREHRKFIEAYRPAIPFLKHIFQDSFVRSQQIDERIIDDFLIALQNRARIVDDDLVKFFVEFFAEVIKVYDPKGGEDNRKLGYKQWPMVKRILDLTVEIANRVLAHIRDRSDRVALLGLGVGSVETFKKALEEELAKYFDSDHGPVQLAVLDHTRDITAQMSEETILDSGIIGAVDRYYTRQFAKLDAVSKEKIAGLYATLAASGPKAREQVIARLNPPVPFPFASRTAPLWATLGDDAGVARLVGTVRTDAAVPMVE